MAVNWQDRSVLVVGTGSAGRRHARALRRLGIREVWTCDPDEGQRRACAAEGPVTREFSSYQAALAARPEAALLCTPSNLHVPMAIDALHQGIHVLCEKPLSKTMDRVEELESAIARSHRVFAVAFCFRFHEGLTRAKTLLDAGAIGRLISIRCIMTENIDDVMGPQQSRYYRETGGVFDLVHEIDIACWLAGQEVTEVQALHGALSDLGFTAPDVAEIHLRFGPRCIGQIHLNFFSGPRTRVTELRGTHGTLAVEFARWDQCSVAVYRSATRTWVREDMPTERDFMFRREDEEFLRAIAEGTPVSCPLPEALRSQRVLACIQGEPRRDPKSRA